MKRNMLLMAVAVIMMSCAGNANTKKANDDTNSRTESVEQVCAAEISGIYSGTLPAASSPGIKMTLNLSADKTFTLTSEYLEEEDGLFTEKGTYTLKGNILTTKAEEGTISYFRVETSQLRMLDQNQKDITGELASLYVLTKTK